MSSDLIPWVVAITLGIAVVVLGLLRNLSETTRNRLPRFDQSYGRETATLGLYEGGQKKGRPLSRRQRRWLIAFCLLMALTYAAFAVLSADDRLHDAIFAGLFVLCAGLHLWQGSSHRSNESAA